MRIKHIVRVKQPAVYMKLKCIKSGGEEFSRWCRRGFEYVQNGEKNIEKNQKN